MTGRRVLLVEDDPRTREMVELYLRREGRRPVPIIMVRARATEDEKLTGLDRGADDTCHGPSSSSADSSGRIGVSEPRTPL